MSGHSKWAQIKREKKIVDQKRGQLFSKLLRAVAIAALLEPNPEFNPRLRAAILKAKDNNVPQENIEGALRRASQEKEALEELLLEAYDANGVAMLIRVVTGNRLRTIAEIKKILGDHQGKLAGSGSVRWAFKTGEEGNRGIAWTAKFTHALSPAGERQLTELVGVLENHDDVQGVFTNASSER